MTRVSAGFSLSRTVVSSPNDRGLIETHRVGSSTELVLVLQRPLLDCLVSSRPGYARTLAHSVLLFNHVLE